MHADKIPSWKFHTLVIAKALDFIEQSHTRGEMKEFDMRESELAISESRESLRHLRKLLEAVPNN